MNERWAIYIDIEGFSVLYPEGDDALWALNKLMLAIHSIGKLVFPELPDRLFAHQVGDGFLIVSNFHEDNLDRAASIATVLMKFITSYGLFARAIISEGGLSGINRLCPDEVLDDCIEEDPLTVRMGAGLMTIFPVMGTALINAVSIDKIAPKGPILVLPMTYRDRLSSNFLTTAIEGSETMAIDWIHTEGELLTTIKAKANLELPSPKDIEILLVQYMSKHKLPSEWVNSCSNYLGVIHV